MTFPVDSPFFPDDLVSRLFEAAAEKNVPAVASAGERLHPAFALWPIGLLSRLDEFLHAAGGRKMMTFLEQECAVPVSFPDRSFDPFLNINTPADLAGAEAIAKLYFGS